MTRTTDDPGQDAAKLQDGPLKDQGDALLEKTPPEPEADKHENADQKDEQSGQGRS